MPRSVTGRCRNGVHRRLRDPPADERVAPDAIRARIAHIEPVRIWRHYGLMRVRSFPSRHVFLSSLVMKQVFARPDFAVAKGINRLATIEIRTSANISSRCHTNMAGCASA